MRARSALLAVVLVALAAPSAATASGPFGAISAPAGPAGCITVDGSSQDGPGTCADGRALEGARNFVLSPDGRNAYVHGESVAVFARNVVTGALTQLAGTAGCISGDGASDAGPDTCADGRAIPTYTDSGGLVISADGKFVYLGGTDSILVFQRDLATGALTQLGGDDGCVTNLGGSEDGAGTCTDGRNIVGTSSLALSPDPGNPSLQVASYGNFTPGQPAGLLSFSRDAVTGKLTQLPGNSGKDGCVSASGASEDGANTCQNGKALSYGGQITISPDGKNLYSPAYDDDAVAAFTLAPNGLLTQLAGDDGCYSDDGDSDEGVDTCTDVRLMHGPYSALVSPDGNFVYAGMYDNPSGVAIFSRDAGTGKLTEMPGTAGCVTQDGSDDDGAGNCTDGTGFHDTYVLQISPDKRSFYSTGTGGLLAFDRNETTGALTQLPSPFGCLAIDGGPSVGEGIGVCSTQRLLQTDGGNIVLSPDGRSLYRPSYGSDGLAFFARQLPPTCTDASVNAELGVPLAVPLPCSDPNNEALKRQVLTAPSGGALGSINDAAGGVPFTATTIGTKTLTFKAGDGGLESNVAKVTIVAGDKTPASCKPSGTARSGKAKKGVLTISLKCSERARVTAELFVAAKQAKKLKLAAVKLKRIGKGSARAGKAGTIKVKVKLGKKARKRLRGLSKRQVRKLGARLRVTTVDVVGNRSKKTLKLKLAR